MSKKNFTLHDIPIAWVKIQNKNSSVRDISKNIQKIINPSYTSLLVLLGGVRMDANVVFDTHDNLKKAFSGCKS